jgi:hypothetical protein
MIEPYLTNPQNEEHLNGRWLQKIQSGLSQQPLTGSYSNLKAWMTKQYFTNPQMKMTSNERRPQV